MTRALHLYIDTVHPATTFRFLRTFGRVSSSGQTSLTSQMPTSNVIDDPLPGYSRTSFGPNLQVILAQGIGHTVPEQANDVLDWFGLSGTAFSDSTMPSIAIIPSAPTVTGAPGVSSSTTVTQHWEQCGGKY